MKHSVPRSHSLFSRSCPACSHLLLNIASMALLFIAHYSHHRCLDYRHRMVIIPCCSHHRKSHHKLLPPMWILHHIFTRHLLESRCCRNISSHHPVCILDKRILMGDMSKYHQDTHRLNMILIVKDPLLVRRWECFILYNRFLISHRFHTSAHMIGIQFCSHWGTVHLDMYFLMYIPHWWEVKSSNNLYSPYWFLRRMSNMFHRN